MRAKVKATLYGYEIRKWNQIEQIPQVDENTKQNLKYTWVKDNEQKRSCHKKYKNDATVLKILSAIKNFRMLQQFFRISKSLPFASAGMKAQTENK